MYEGKDKSLLDEPRCFHCFKTPDTKLLRCSRCNVAWYCSTTCQAKHYREKHHVICRGIDKCTKQVQEQEAKIRSDPGTNFSAMQCGLLWSWQETLPYMEASYALADWYWRAAYECEVKQVWEKALYHLLEHLRQGAIDHMEIRFRVPFLLLYLNRDDDAFCFIRYWVKLSEVIRKNLEAIYYAHVDTKEGDWIYSHETNCRYSNLFEQTSKRIQDVQTPFHVALAIIKLRIVAAHDAALEGSVARTEINVESQREQINWFLSAVIQQSPSMLPAIINPRPLTDQPPPKEVIQGHLSEVYRTVMDGRRCFERVPGAMDMLKRNFGENPIYDWDMSS